MPDFNGFYIVEIISVLHPNHSQLPIHVLKCLTGHRLPPPPAESYLCTDASREAARLLYPTGW